MSRHANSQSRMFRALVMMGSGIALSCGGVAQEDGSKTANGGSSGGKPSTGNAGANNVGGTATSSFGGTSAVSAGGTLTIDLGGTTSLGIGGTSGASAAGGAPPTDCPPSQWTCANDDNCSYETGWTPVNCKCDPARPKSAANCPAGQTFTCRSTSYGSAEPYGFECSCVTPTDTRCSCYTAYPSSNYYNCDTQSVPDTTLCGCAIALLK